MSADMIVWIASSSALILAVFLIRALFRKKLGPGAVYALWAIVLLRLLIPGTLSFFKNPVSIENAVSKTELYENVQAVSGVSEIELGDSGVVTGKSSTPAAAITPSDPETHTSSPAASAPKPADTVIIMENTTPQRFERMQKTIKARDVLTAVYFTGMALTAVYFIFANVRLYLKLRRSRVELNTAAPVKVYSVDGLDSSCFFLNSIYCAKENASDPTRLGYVLAHELAHRRHGDAVIALLRCIALALHWYNPLVWAAAFASRRDAELFADAGAIRTLGENEREDYGKTLIELSVKPKVSANIAYAATTMTNGKGELRSRIRSIALGRRTGLVLGVAALVIALAVALPAFIGSKAKESPHKTAEAVPAEATVTPTGETVSETPAPDQTPAPTPSAAPTATPKPESPLDEWFVEECWSLAELANEVHGYHFTREQYTLDDYGSSAYLTFFTDEGDRILCAFDKVYGEYSLYDHMIYTDFTEEEFAELFGRYKPIDQCVEEIPLAGYAVNVTAAEIEAAGYHLNGTELTDENLRVLAQYRADILTSQYMNASEDNALRCREAYSRGFRIKRLTGSEEAGFICWSSLALRPVDPRFFSNYYSDVGCSILGYDAGEYAGWFSFGFQVLIKIEADGSFTLSTACISG